MLQEARLAIETTRKMQVATHLSAWSNRNSISLVRDWISDGAIGPLREVHNWINKPIWPQWPKNPTETPPIPKGFDWDLWLGPALYRPYHPNYTHAVFRGWYDFGSGILGDMGIYSLWPVFMAFDLDAPISIEATPSFTCEIIDHVSGIQENDVSFPHASTIRFRFPARREMPPLDIYWYDGGMRPPTPEELDMDDKEMPASGMMFVGNFENARACSEAICLGAVALRVGRKIEWDSKNMKITNMPEANELLYRKYRKGWEL